MTTLERALNSIGKKCFVINFEKFKHVEDKKALARQLLAQNNKAFSLNAQLTRINYAMWIFANKFEKEALSCILSSNVRQDVKNKTVLLLDDLI